MNSPLELVPLILETSLVLALVSVGFQGRWSDLAYTVKHPFLLLRGILAVNVLVPLAAVTLSAMFPLEPIVKAGIILMAVAPLPPAVPGKMLQLGAASSVSIGLFVVLVVLSIMTVPLTLALLSAIYPIDVTFAPAAMARLVISSVLLPLLIGLGLGTLFPAFALRAAGLAQALSGVGLLITLILVTIKSWNAILTLVGNGALLVITLTIAVGLIAGRVLGGSEPHDRAALSAAAAIRHPGLAGAIAAANFTDPLFAPVIVMFLLTGLVMTAIYFGVGKFRAARPQNTS